MILSLLIIIFLLLLVSLSYYKKNNKLNNIIKISRSLFAQQANLILAWDEVPAEHNSPYILGSVKYKALNNLDWLSEQSEEIKKAWASWCKDRENFDNIVTIEQQEIFISARYHKNIWFLYFRFQDLSAEDNKNPQIAEAQLLEELCNNLPCAMWISKNNDNLLWANKFYQGLINGNSSAKSSDNLWGLKADNEIAEYFHKGKRFNDRVALVSGGERRIFDLSVINKNKISLGYAAEVTKEDLLTYEIKQQDKVRLEILHHLSTGIAIFNKQRKLSFYNPAFSQMWNLDANFLDMSPNPNLLLDKFSLDNRLSSPCQGKKLVEPAVSMDLKGEMQEDIWHLPNGIVLRVIAHYNNMGELIWMFDNLTEQLELETRYNGLINAQGETLDCLSEGVVVFGPDGLLKLANPAFANIWQLSDDLVVEGIHINAISNACYEKHKVNIWNELTQAVVGGTYIREIKKSRIELKGECFYDLVSSPLPNGQTMITFVDITDSVYVERALQEKNEALRTADKLRNDFVHHVSYELRTPLTNIIGFTEFLYNIEDPLTAKQKDYLDCIQTSSIELLDIVNDILDLARVDAGLLSLELEEVKISDIMQQVYSRLDSKLTKKNLTINDSEVDGDLIAYVDKNRYRQILTALLANAISHSPDNSEIKVSIYKIGNNFILKVSDKSQGIVKEDQENLFKHFKSYGRHSGSGIGLAIVKTLVELHGGEIKLDTTENDGVTFLCSFPISNNELTNELIEDKLKICNSHG